ncbi:hypothetical protein GIB67_004139, partial [Kingdonia uniflora]
GDFFLLQSRRQFCGPCWYALFFDFHAQALCDLCLDPSQVGVLRNRCKHNLTEKFCFFDLFAYSLHQGRFANPSHSVNPDQVGFIIHQCLNDFILGGFS